MAYGCRVSPFCPTLAEDNSSGTECLMPRFASFSRCRARAEAHCRKLQAGGSAAVLGFGNFRPRTAPETWDERWRELARQHPYTWRDTGFAHYWVEVAGTIHDPSADQFGEPAGLLVVPIGDERYVRRGSYSGLASTKRV